MRRKKASQKSGSKPVRAFKRAASSVRRAVTRRGRQGGDGRQKTEVPAPKRPAEVRHARPKRRESDIPLDRLANEYIPTQTSLKGPFRTTAADRGSDQEFAEGVADERWNDEDRFTNKSGDARIGTHGRKYEPDE